MKLGEPLAQTEGQTVDAVSVDSLLGDAEEPEDGDDGKDGDIVVVHLNEVGFGIGVIGDPGKAGTVVRLREVVRLQVVQPIHNVAVQEEHLNGEVGNHNDDG